MMNITSQKRNIDIVFCIDGTGSMTPCIQSVKENACRFYREFIDQMKTGQDPIGNLRVKVIVFRDYKCDGAHSMEISPFFELPADEDDFSAHLDGIEASGGCDEDANGLEALYYAMKSDFTAGESDRQVIVLFADTTAIPLRKRRKYQGYPSDMVDENGLAAMWACTQMYPTKLREKNKRLVLFGPSHSCYNRMASRYNRTIFTPVEIHRGLDDISFTEIVKLIAKASH